MNCPNCEATQGRAQGCLRCTNATRRVLGMQPLPDPYEEEEWEQAKSIFWSVVVFSIFGVVAWIATA